MGNGLYIDPEGRKRIIDRDQKKREVGSGGGGRDKEAGRNQRSLIREAVKIQKKHGHTHVIWGSFAM